MKFSIKNKVLFLDETPLPLQDIQVIELLGQGANAYVFKVYNTQNKRFEALKVWYPENTNSIPDSRNLPPGEFNSRGLTEIYLTGTSNNHYYCLMEYINGVSLEAFLKQEPPFQGRIFYLQQTLLAFKEVYTHGTFHSEVLSDNIIVDTDNRKVFLRDLGTSRFLQKKPSSQKNSKLLLRLCFEVLPELKNTPIVMKNLAKKSPLTVVTIMELIITLLLNINEKKPERWDQYSLIQDIVLKVDTIKKAYKNEDLHLRISQVNKFFDSIKFPKEKAKILKSWYRKLTDNPDF